jgi:hypothetical protein
VANNKNYKHVAKQKHNFLRQIFFPHNHSTLIGVFKKSNNYFLAPYLGLAVKAFGESKQTKVEVSTASLHLSLSAGTLCTHCRKRHRIPLQLKSGLPDFS